MGSPKTALRAVEAHRGDRHADQRPDRAEVLRGNDETGGRDQARQSVTQNNKKMPTSRVGIASAMNINCQPARPQRPLSSRSAVDIGAPAATASGSATMNPETMRARCQSGNQ